MSAQGTRTLTQTQHQPELVLWGADVRVGRRRSGRVGEILTAIARAKRNAVLYSTDHPVIAETIADVRQIIEHHVAARSSLMISVHEDTFFAENTLLLEESLRLYSLLLTLREREVGSIEFLQGVEPWELARLIDVLNQTPASLREAGGAPVHLLQQDVRRVVLAPPRPLSPEELARLKVDPRDAYRAALRAMDELSFEASLDLPLELRKARLVLKSIIDILGVDQTSILGVAAIKDYDEDTFHHCVNVSILSLMMGARLQLDRVLMVTLGLAALLHDIGKVRVPSEVITKPGTLTPDELELVRRHPIYGAHLLDGLTGLARLAMVVAFEHHANYDLSGYPRMTIKKIPHLLSRIVQLADVYDAATSSRRLYRRPMMPAEGVRFVLVNAGRLFDPMLARLFVQMMGLYPVGSVVELDTGELAVAIRPGQHEVARPVVRVVRNAVGEPFQPYTLDLEEQRERRIVRALDPVDAGVNVIAYV